MRVTRAASAVEFPARFLLVAAMNPCPCGRGVGTSGSCRCSDRARLRYQNRLSGPVLDRFDLRLPIQRPDPDELVGATPGETTATIAARVADVRQLSAQRTGATNAEMTDEQLLRFAALNPGAERLMHLKLSAGSLSARWFARVRRVARTLADLDGRDGVLTEEDVATALELRAEFEAFRG